jgi:hypothetical protein
VVQWMLQKPWEDESTIGRAGCSESCKSRFGKGRLETYLITGNALAAYFDKGADHLLASVEDRFRFIEHHRGQFEVRIMCRVLSVSVSGFYAWLKRPPEAREREDGEITQQILNIYHQHKGRYGSPRIHAQLRDEGIYLGRKRVVRLMKQAQLVAHHTTHRVVTTHADPAATPAENVLDRAFEAEHPNEKWVADVTYIPTGCGWMYRCLGTRPLFSAYCRLGNGGQAG